MDEVRVVRRRTHLWPIVIALIVLAVVIGWAFFTMSGGARSNIGWVPAPSPSLPEAVITRPV